MGRSRRVGWERNAMRSRLRSITLVGLGVAVGAFVAAPAAHLIGHEDDHIHVGGAIIPIEADGSGRPKARPHGGHAHRPAHRRADGHLHRPADGPAHRNPDGRGHRHAAGGAGESGDEVQVEPVRGRGEGRDAEAPSPHSEGIPEPPHGDGSLAHFGASLTSSASVPTLERRLESGQTGLRPPDSRDSTQPPLTDRRARAPPRP